MNGANAAMGTVERSDYERLMQLDRQEQFQDFVEKAVRLQRVWMDLMAAGLRLFLSNLPTNTWPRDDGDDRDWDRDRSNGRSARSDKDDRAKASSSA